MAKRDQPLMVIITHAGTDDEGICFEEYELAKRVLTGATNLETTLPVIFELPRGGRLDGSGALGARQSGTWDHGLA